MRRAMYVLLGVLFVPTVGLVGDIVTDGRFTSTMSSGAPLDVASSDMVVNLNADMVDGLDAATFAVINDTYTKAEVDAMIAAASAADPRRAYYLTPSKRNADEDILAACDTDFHMASIWEILDPSNLKYDTVRGFTSGNSGNGPSVSRGGWIRIGDEGGPSSDCDIWGDSGARGIVAFLSDGLPGAATNISPWSTNLVDCEVAYRVWCVED